MGPVRGPNLGSAWRLVGGGRAARQISSRDSARRSTRARQPSSLIFYLTFGLRHFGTQLSARHDDDFRHQVGASRVEREGRGGSSAYFFGGRLRRDRRSVATKQKRHGTLAAWSDSGLQVWQLGAVALRAYSSKRLSPILGWRAGPPSGSLREKPQYLYRNRSS